MPAIREVLAVSIALHGIAHLIAFGAILVHLAGIRTPWVILGTWMRSSLTIRQAAAIAAPFWLVSSLSFLASAAGVQGWSTAGVTWRTLAILGACVSLVGMSLFPGAWPGARTRRRSLLNTSIAAFMNLVLLIVIGLLSWPLPALSG